MKHNLRLSGAWEKIVSRIFDRVVIPMLVAWGIVICMPSAHADNVDGAWSTLENWPLIAIHAAITPDGRVLSYGTRGDGKQTGFFIYDIWDPVEGLTGSSAHITLQNYTNTDIFCSSQIILPQSGEIVIAGGDNWTGTGTTNTGNSNSNIFNYADDTLVSGSSMNRARWYSSATALVNGEVYIQGGNGGADRPEVRQTDGLFRLLTSAATNSYATIFPRNFLAPDGRVFGYDTNGKMFFVNPNGTGSIISAGSFSSSYAGWTSGAAMFQPGKILQMGGNSAGAVVIDINGPTPTATATQSQPGSIARHWVSTTVLADGRVLATGGSSSANQLSGVNNYAEIWDPDTGLWTRGAEGAIARLYHSSALLLPDASVLVAGGGAPGPHNNTNAEIYYPPYLFASGGGFATRPQIVSAPDTANVGDFLNVQVGASTISRVTIVKTGSVTHSVNMDQRFVELPFTQSGNMLSVTLPVRASDTPPGFYMMFAIDGSGVPSESSMLKINVDPTPNTAVDYTSAIGGGGGSSFQLACNTDQVLVGIHGKAATYVNQIGPQCVQMNQFGQWIGDPVNGSVTGTTTSGSSFSKTCPRDMAMGGFQGRSDQYVNQLDIECRALTPAGGLMGDGQFLGPDGGSGGSIQGLKRCGTSNPGYALYGRSGGWLDNFGLQCKTGFVTTVSVNSTPVVVNPGPQSGVTGVPVNLQIGASDGDGDDLTFSATNLPNGLTINTDTGQITGSPTVAQTFSVEVTVTDGTESDSATFDWVIDPALPLSVAPMVPPPPQPVNTVVNYTAEASGGTNVVYRWDFGDGTPETGYSGSPTIAHTFANPGIYYITLTVNDAAGVPNFQSFVQGVHLPHTANRPANSTNILFEEISGGNSRIWVANQDNDSVTVFDAVTQAKISEIPVGIDPRSVAISTDGRIWVTNKSSADISVIDPSSLAVVQTVALPFASQPYGLVVSPASSEAYVVLQASNRVLKLDALSGAQLGSFDTKAFPRHLAINSGGDRIYVSRFITGPQPGEHTATVQAQIGGLDVGGEVQVVDTATMTEVSTIVLQHNKDGEVTDAENQGRGVPNYVGAMAISPDGQSARVPSKMDNIYRGESRDPGFNLNFQNTVRSISSRIDLATNLEDYPRRIDYDNSSISSAAIYDPSGVYAFVALETSREIAVVDAYAFVELFRIDTGRAPQGMAISPDGLKLYVNNFMDRTVDIFDLTTLQTLGQWSVNALGTLPTVAVDSLGPQILNGKQLFYDAHDTRLAFDRYLSCASCHNDGFHDGRTWDITGFGEGLRNTIDLRGHGQGQGRKHWTANFDEVHDFEGQIRDLAAGDGLMADVDFLAGTRSEPLGDPKAGISPDLDALAAYVDSLVSFDQSPYRNGDGTLTTDALVGREIFRQENCGSCHGGASFSDSNTDSLHDIGTITLTSGQRLGAALTGFDTPTLRGVWASAPYLHDGSAETLQGAITAHSSVSLGSADLLALVSYLKQIDGSEATAPVPRVFLQDSGGLLVIEAEHFNSNVGGAVGPWEVIADGAASNGKAIKADPVATGTEDQATSPRVDYRGEFSREGKHHLWVRARSFDGGSDSMYASLDDQTWKRRSISPNDGQWVWIYFGRHTVTGTGEHMIRLYRREANAEVDKVLLTTDGTYIPTGLDATESSQVGGNKSPLASLIAVPDTGNAPLVVGFDGRASNDPDGTIVQYGWDFDGNGSYDQTTVVATTSYTYDVPGSFNATLRVTDDGGATSTASLPVTVAANPTNLPPVASVVVAPDAGAAPLLVGLDGSASNDPDGTIVQYEWDFDGNGSYDQNTLVATTSYTYSVPGSFNATLRVTDNSGATSTTSAPVTVTGSSAFLQDSGGLLVIEAEHFNSNVGGAVGPWEVIADGAASNGEAIKADPVATGTEDQATSPRVDYRGEFSREGKHHLWVRARSFDGGSDSLYASLDDQTWKRRSISPNDGQWVWIYFGRHTVTGTGEHMIRLYRREANAEVDKVLLTTDGTYIPTGLDATESSQVGAP